MYQCVSPSFENSVSLGQVICQICSHQWKTENGHIYAPIPQWYLKCNNQYTRYTTQPCIFSSFFQSWFCIVLTYNMVCSWTRWKLTCAMSQAVTWSFRATKSKEWTLCGTFLAIFASPHPKSATTLLPGLKSKMLHSHDQHLSVPKIYLWKPFTFTKDFDLQLLNVLDKQINWICRPFVNLGLEALMVDLERLLILLKHFLRLLTSLGV